MLPPDRLFLLGSTSPTPISTDYARQKHNDSAERIYFLSSARLRVFFKWSYAVPTILMLLLVSDKNPQGQTLTKDTKIALYHRNGTTTDKRIWHLRKHKTRLFFKESYRKNRNEYFV